MIRKRDARWASATERARVAAQLLEEAQALTDTGVIASPAELQRDRLPAPLHVPTLETAAPPADAAPPHEPPAAPAAAAPAARLRTSDMVEALNASQRELELRLRSAPDDAAALLELGVLLCRKGLWSAAAGHLRRAAELAPGEVATWCRLGETLNKLDDLDGARAAYERVVALDAGHARALYGLGVIFDRLSRPADATAMYRRSREAAGR